MPEEGKESSPLPPRFIGMARLQMMEPGTPGIANPKWNTSDSGVKKSLLFRVNPPFHNILIINNISRKYFKLC